MIVNNPCLVKSRERRFYFGNYQGHETGAKATKRKARDDSRQYRAQPGAVGGLGSGAGLSEPFRLGGRPDRRRTQKEENAVTSLLSCTHVKRTVGQSLSSP